jgi:hypothetical protein
MPLGLHVEARFEGSGVVAGTTLYAVAKEIWEKIRKQKIAFMIGQLGMLGRRLGTR